MQTQGVGKLDWVEIWRQMYDDKHAQSKEVCEPGFELPSDYWEAISDRFAASARRAPQPDGFMDFLISRLRPTDIVLDVGAGTGRYLPQIAPQVTEVLAIEPSASMRKKLEATIADYRLTNVRIVTETWPEWDMATIQAMAVMVKYPLHC